MPTDDELIRRLTMGGLDPHMAALVADKHGEQRVVKVPFDAATPHLTDGTFEVLTLDPGDLLLGYAGAVQQTFHTTVRAVAAAAGAPTLPVTVDGTHNAIGQIGAVAGPWIVPNGVYATLQTLVDALNAATVVSGSHVIGEVGAFSSSGGKLLFTALEGRSGVLTVAGSHDVGVAAALGFTVASTLVAATAASQPDLYLLGPGAAPGDGNEITTVDVWTAADVTATFGLNSLLTPRRLAGLANGAAALGYVDPGGSPLTLRAAVVDRLAAATNYPDPHLNGTGKGFLWFWVSSLF